MPIYDVQAPDGRIYSVEAPAGTPQEQIFAFVRSQMGQAEAPSALKEGIGAALAGGFKRFLSTGETALESIIDPELAARRGVERAEQIGQQYAPGASLEKVKQAYAERGLFPAIGEAVSQIPSALAEQAPQIAATLGSAKLGAMAGAPFGGPVGALIGGVGGAALPSLVQLYGSNIERQAQENAPEISRTAALGAAAPGAALEVASTFIPLGRNLIGKLLGPTAEKALARGSNEAIERAANESVTASLLKGTGVGALAEIPTEVAQQMLERFQAGLPLTTEDALKEYGEAAYGAGLVGGPFGAAARTLGRPAARSEFEKLQEQEQAKLAVSEEELAEKFPEGLPGGFKINREEVGRETTPQGFSIMAEGREEPLSVVDTKEEADAKLESLSKIRAEERENLLKEEEKINAEVQKAKDRLERLEATEQTSTDEYKSLKAELPTMMDESAQKIKDLYNRAESLSKPLTAVPFGETERIKEQFTVVGPDAKPVGTFNTMGEAEAVVKQSVGEDVFEKTQKSREVAKELYKTFVPQMRKFGLGDVGLNIVDKIENGAGGAYLDKLIRVSLEEANPVQVMRHESLHAMKDLGFFTPQQWKALEERANKQWIKEFLEGQKTKVDGQEMTRLEGYRKLGYSEQDIIEEAIADAFGAYDKGAKPPPGMIAALFRKIKDFFSSLGQALRGAGFQSADDIFQQIERGRLKPAAVKPAAEAKPAAKEKLSLAPEGIPQKIWSLHEKVQLADDEATGRIAITTEKGKAPGALKRNQTMTFRRLNKEVMDFVGGDQQKALDLMSKMSAISGIRDAIKNEDDRALETYKVANPELYAQEVGKKKLSLAKPSAANAWQADAATIKAADKFEEENGIRPYVSEGFLDLPIKAPKYSLQKFNPEKHLKFDPTLGVPINKDGTVTVYYHTTKQKSLAIGQKKVIPSEGRNRVYLTNESGGDAILRNRGNFDQELDGSTVLVYVTPDMLQLDAEYDNGRRDFFIPLAQGDFFNKKMKMQSIQKGRQEAITGEFSYDDHEKRIAKAVKAYKDATPAERKKLVSAARKLLKKEHNVGSLLSENGKLEKTRVGEYGLDYQGNSVASQGLGLAAAQKISEKVSTCPRSAICEGLCLGETSGGNFMFGGIAAEDVDDIAKSAFRAGPRMMQYLKTEALIINPEAFSTVLQAEIDSLKKWSASPTQTKINKETKKREQIEKEIYQPAVRLNVTSDFKPEMFRAVIESNPDVQFYDYTKLGSESIAPNHHLTYSSTGFGQIVNGEKVFFKTKTGQYDHNWATMRDRRLNNGQNVAMAFSSKSALPKFVVDEETGERYRVWDGDDYDARFLDPKQPDGKGMIIGLRNKAGNLSEKNATQKTGGFFVQYDPKKDGDTVVVPNQAQFKEGGRKVIPVAKAEKLSLKGVRFPTAKEAKEAVKAAGTPDTAEFKQYNAGNQWVDADGKPKVFYHATARNFFEFTPAGQSQAIFLAETPEEAEGFGSIAEDKLRREVYRALSKDEKLNLFKGVVDSAIEKKTITEKQGQDFMRQASRKVPDYGDFGDIEQNVYDALMDLSPTRMSIMPLYARAMSPFDFENKEHVDQVMNWVANNTQYPQDFPEKWLNGMKGRISQGLWQAIEDKRVQQAIRTLGFDAFTVRENRASPKNYAVYQPQQVKSVTGNDGSFSLETKDIRYSLKSVRYTPERLEDLWMKSLYTETGRENTTRGYVAFVDPMDFVRATTTKEYLPTLRREQEPLDFDKMKGLGPIGLSVSSDEDGNWKITGHEGRHRMLALHEAGYRDVPIFLEIARGIKDAKAIPVKTIKAELPDSISSILMIAEAEPLSFANKDKVMEKFTDLNGKVKYSLPNLSKATRDRMNDVAPQRYKPNWKDRVIGAFKQDYTQLRQTFINRYETLSVYDRAYREKVRKAGGPEVLADQSAEFAALQSDLSAGVAAAAMGIGDRQGGVPVYRNGVTTIDTSVKGLTEALAPLAKYGDPEIYQRYQFWAGWKRGRRLLREGREELYNAADAQKAQEIERNHPEFVQVQKDLIAFNNGIVNYAVQTGVLSKERAQVYTKYADYIPFYRQLELDQTIGPNPFSGISGQKGPKKLKGSQEVLGDFMENMVRNTQSMINAGMKNAAAQMATKVALEINQVERMPGPIKGLGVDAYTVLENGQLVYYRANDKLFVDSLASLHMPDLPFMGLLSAPANLLRSLVTKDPGFMLANLLRDSLSSYVTSGQKITPVVGTMANFGKALSGKNKTLQALFNAGVIGGYEFSQNIEQSGESLTADLNKKAGKDPILLRPFKSLWDGLEKGTTASDAATRMAVYERVMQETGNEAEAISRALEVMNFNRKGNSVLIRIATAALPFFNARLQGLDLFWRASTGRMNTTDAQEIKRRFWIRGVTMMSLSVMYYLSVADDEEYEKQEEETKDNNWIFPSLGIRVPIPFEVGTLFKTMPERITAYLMGNDTGKELGESTLRALANTFAFNPIPQTFKPLIEAATNFNFFTMRPIVGQGMQDVAPQFQVGPGTSKTAEFIGGKLNLSPLKVDQILKGYTGTIGGYAVDVVDAIASEFSDAPKAAKRFEQMPVVKRFALDPEARGNVTQFYELQKAVDTFVRTSNLLEKTARPEEFAKYLEDNVGLLAVKDYVSNVEKEMKTLRDMKRTIASSDMSPEEKRDLTVEIGRMENHLTANIGQVKKVVNELK